MCGIAGIVNLDGRLPVPERERLIEMIRVLRHRGPDEFGVYRDQSVGLGHARLSIIDLATGQQPLSNESETLWIVFNGEIFNYVELRNDLEARGHRFRTHSDTEVIVHAYEQWGDDAFRRFNGQWALALWDSERHSLVLARDPFGVRPLYVCERGGRLLFASEVKAIFAVDPSLPRSFDPVGLEQVFTFWTTVAPKTVFEGIEEIEPGVVRTYERRTITESRAYVPGYYETGEVYHHSPGEAAEALRAALERATSLRMLRADVPVGAYLSGGLDSSLVATLGLRAKGSKFCTFSLRFEAPEYDETRWQRLMAQYLGSEHHEVVVSARDIASVFPDVVAHAERPVLRTAPAPLYLLSRLVRDSGIKVVLTGEGADEQFAGYDLFREARVRRFWARQPDSRARPRLLERLYPYLARSPVSQGAMTSQFFGQNLDHWAEPGFGHDLRWRGTAAVRRLLSAEHQRRVNGHDVRAALLSALPEGFGRWSYLAQDQYLEIRTLLSGYLLSAQGDRMLMAHSVEGRFPYLDRDVTALAEALPPSFKLRGLDEKHILKRVSSDLLPPMIVKRKKQPYRAPDALAFVGRNEPGWLEDVVSERSLADAGVFDPTAARRLIQKCQDRSEEAQLSNADNMAFVGIVSTQLVHDRLLRHRPPAADVPRLRTCVDRTLGAVAS
jgi:asparagine synthase (glutamine-hydrolysing)